MGNREAIVEVIRHAYEARGRGDLDALMAIFHPEAVFTLIGDKKALEVTGSFHGHDGVREWECLALTELETYFVEAAVVCAQQPQVARYTSAQWETLVAA